MRCRTRGTALYSGKNYLVDVMLPFWFRHIVKLLIALPLVEQVTHGHQPNLLLRPVEQGHPVKDQSGKQFLIAYPTAAFFESSSDSTSRLVPLYIASMMAFL